MKKDHIRYINHVTMNTGHTVQYTDVPMMPGIEGSFVSDVADRVMEGNDVEFSNGVRLHCIVCPAEKVYSSTLSIGQQSDVVIVTASGAVDDRNAGELWSLTEDLYEQIFHQVTPAVCPKAPFICSIVNPLSGSDEDVIKWSSCFIKFFGIEMLSRLSGRRKNSHTEKEQDKIMGKDIEGHKSRMGTSTFFKEGNSYTEVIGYPESAFFDIDDGGMILNIFMKRVTKHEIDQVISGMPFEMKLVQLRGIIFLLFKFGDLGWIDAPYNVHLSRDLTHLGITEDSHGFPLLVRLFDTATGKLHRIRHISLSKEIGLKLIDMITEQYGQPFDKISYSNSIRNIYAAYPTKKLVKMALFSCKMPGDRK